VPHSNQARSQPRALARPSGPRPPGTEARAPGGLGAGGWGPGAGGWGLGAGGWTIEIEIEIAIGIEKK
jgi:hypothetical protein